MATSIASLNQRQPPRDAGVGGAGRRVAAGMIMGEDNALAAVAHGVDDDVADREVGAIGVAVVRVR